MANPNATTLSQVIGVAAGSVLVALLNLMVGGNVFATLGLIFILVFLALSILRPTLSLYALIFLSLAIEQGGAPGSWTENIPYHTNLNTAYPFLRLLSTNPLEIHLGCIIVGLLLRFLLLREKSAPVLAGKALLLYMGSVVFFIAYGMIRGGAFLPALWETRGIFYLGILTVIVPQIVRTRKQVDHALWAIVAGIAFRIVEVNYSYISAGFSLVGSVNGWGSHEDAGFYVVVIIFAITLVSLKIPASPLKKIMVALIVPAIIAVVASDRRTVYPIMVAGLLLLTFILPPQVQKRLKSLSWKLAVVFLLYLGVFWNSQSSNPIVMPARSIREGLAGDDAAQAGESYTSNLYRKVENYDLYKMARSQPVLGYGYGSLIEYVLPVPVTWELGLYVPHNQILGVLAKTGLVGYSVFFFFYLSVFAHLARGFKRVEDDHYAQALLALAGVAVINHIVYSFFDIVLTYYRCNVVLGTLFGMAATILTVREQTTKKAEAQVSKAEPANVRTTWLLQPHREEADMVRN